MIFTAADEEESALPTSPQLASLGNAQDNSYAESSHLFSIAALKQQKLKAWKPLLRPTTFIPFLFLVGVISIPLGAVFLGAFSNTFEMNIDYTDCLPSENSSLQQSRSSESSSICEYSFSVSSLVQGPILLYYQLENYYQNSRIYVKSVEPNQLQGQALPYSQLSDCSPLQGPPGFDSMGDQRPVYYPCGLIANSFFNDTFSVIQSGAGPLNFTHFEGDGLSWDSTSSFYQPSTYNLTNMKVYPPPFWQNRLDLDLNSTDGSYLSLPNLSSNAAFQGWMGVAGMNNFRKLYGYYEGDLEPGSSYKVLVDSRFVTISFQGRKYIVLTNNSYLGGKNPTLGITYLIVGILILLIAIFLLLCYLLNNPRKLGDLSQLSWVVAGAAVDSNEKEPEAQQRTNERSNIL